MAILATGLAPASHAKLKDPQKLVSFFKIELPGWQVKAGYPKFERLRVEGQSYVEAQVIYTSGKSKVAAAIMVGDVGKDIAQVRGFRVSNNKEGYCRKTAIQGFEAVEIYSNAKKTGYLFILVAADCLIPMEVKNVGSTKV